MTNARALSRVRRDLAAGHPRAAVRRLRTMLAADPSDLEVYRLLSEVNRTVGNSAEAGRWGYLTGDATDEEMAAFERAHPQPWIRLQLLGWQGSPETLPDQGARARLAHLHDLVSQTTIPIQRQAARPSARRQAGGTATLTPGMNAVGAATGTTVTGTTTAGTTTTTTATATGTTSTMRRSATIPSQRGPHAPAGHPHPSEGQQPVPAVKTPETFTSQPTPDQRIADQPTITIKPAKQKKGAWQRDGQRPFAVVARNYAILLVLILTGSVGSVVAVGGIRTLFGVKNGLSPVTTLFHALVKEIAKLIAS
jgi:Family of unknown function (DUF6584)